MHFVSSYLYLKRLSIRCNKCCMKRLVIIRLRHCNIILETSRNRLIHFVYYTKCRITVFYSVNLDSYCKYVIYLVKRLILVNHFSVD